MPKKTVTATLEGEMVASNEIIINGLSYEPTDHEFIKLAKINMKQGGHGDDHIMNAVYEVIDCKPAEVNF